MDDYDDDDEYSDPDPYPYPASDSPDDGDNYLRPLGNMRLGEVGNLDPPAADDDDDDDDADIADDVVQRVAGLTVADGLSALDVELPTDLGFIDGWYELLKIDDITEVRNPPLTGESIAAPTSVKVSVGWTAMALTAIAGRLKNTIRPYEDCALQEQRYTSPEAYVASILPLAVTRDLGLAIAFLYFSVERPVPVGTDPEDAEALVLARERLWNIAMPVYDMTAGRSIGEWHDPLGVQRMRFMGRRLRHFGCRNNTSVHRGVPNYLVRLVMSDGGAVSLTCSTIGAAVVAIADSADYGVQLAVRYPAFTEMIGFFAARPAVYDSRRSVYTPVVPAYGVDYRHTPHAWDVRERAALIVERGLLVMFVTLSGAVAVMNHRHIDTACFAQIRTAHRLTAVFGGLPLVLLDSSVHLEPRITFIDQQPVDFYPSASVDPTTAPSGWAQTHGAGGVSQIDRAEAGSILELSDPVLKRVGGSAPQTLFVSRTWMIAAVEAAAGRVDDCVVRESPALRGRQNAPNDLTPTEWLRLTLPNTLVRAVSVAVGLLFYILERGRSDECPPLDQAEMRAADNLNRARLALYNTVLPIYTLWSINPLVTMNQYPSLGETDLPFTLLQIRMLGRRVFVTDVSTGLAQRRAIRGGVQPGFRTGPLVRLPTLAFIRNLEGTLLLTCATLGTGVIYNPNAWPFGARACGRYPPFIEPDGLLAGTDIAQAEFDRGERWAAAHERFRLGEFAWHTRTAGGHDWLNMWRTGAVVGGAATEPMVRRMNTVFGIADLFGANADQFPGCHCGGAAGFPDDPPPLLPPPPPPLPLPEEDSPPPPRRRPRPRHYDSPYSRPRQRVRHRDEPLLRRRRRSSGGSNGSGGDGNLIVGGRRVQDDHVDVVDSSRGGADEDLVASDHHRPCSDQQHRAPGDNSPVAGGDRTTDNYDHFT